MTENLFRVAIASKDGIGITEHFGHAKFFYIYEVTCEKSHFIEKRNVSHYCLGGHSDKGALADILETISDCSAVFVSKIGDGPAEKLEAKGITAISKYAWEEIEPSLLDFYSNN